MEQTELEAGLPTLEDGTGTEAESKEDKRSEKANTQGCRVGAEAGGSSREKEVVQSSPLTAHRPVTLASQTSPNP